MSNDLTPETEISAPIAAVIGASGYAGAELVRLIHAHPRLTLGPLCARRAAGRDVSDVIPSLRGILSGDLLAIKPETLECDIAFLALPHGASAPIAAVLRGRGILVIDLSADFRLDDKAVYSEWYGEHGAPNLFGSATYGLVELHRETLKDADLIAVPGCYPTATILALAPLIDAKLIEFSGIIIDAKSGVSGAGRNPSGGAHLPECAEGLRAYKAGGQHRHTPEIEQVLGGLAGTPLRVTFTPHLVPMTRGILVTAYAALQSGVDLSVCYEAARSFYEDSPMVSVVDELVDTLWVRGSSRAMVGYRVDERTNRVVAFGAIDNLLKGAAGQAIQAANIRLGFEETTGIDQLPTFP